MDDTSTVNGVFLYTKKLDSELMVRCLQAMLNNLPDIKFTSIIADEKFLGYRVHFSSPGEKVVLAKLHLMVYGENIRICPLKTCLAINTTDSRGDVLLENEVKDAIDSKFGEVLVILPISEFSSNFRAFTNIPEIKAIEIFQRGGSREILLPLPNKKLKLIVTLCCTYCKKDDHVSGDCHQTSVTDRRTSNDTESAFADSTMKFDMNFESTETYAEKIGREEIMKKGYFSEENQTGENKCIPEKKEFKKEPEFHSSAGISGENLPITSHNNEQLKSTSDDDIQIIPPQDNRTTSSDKSGIKFERKSTLLAPGSSNSAEVENPLKKSSGPSYKKRRVTKPVIAVEDMNVLSESLQDFINKACEDSGIITREKLEAFFHHVKKKSNVFEVASKYTTDLVQLKKLLQRISAYFYSTKDGTKNDQRFIQWLDDRIEKFDKKVPQKRKRPN